MKKSKHTLDEFIDAIPLRRILEVLSKTEYKRFDKFMRGQTMRIENGAGFVYREDLEHFLAGDDSLYD